MNKKGANFFSFFSLRKPTFFVGLLSYPSADMCILFHTRRMPSSTKRMRRRLYKSPTAFLKVFLLTPNAS